MRYQLRYSKSARKDIKKLDIVMRRRLKNKLDRFIKNPLSISKKLRPYQLGQYRYRIGNLRIIFDISNSYITILRIGFRGDIYK